MSDCIEVNTQSRMYRLFLLSRRYNDPPKDFCEYMSGVIKSVLIILFWTIAILFWTIAAGSNTERKTEMSNNAVYCSFYGRSNRNVEIIICSEKGSKICNVCVNICVEDIARIRMSTSAYKIQNFLITH